MTHGYEQSPVTGMSAVILAGGRSLRMEGASKPALPIGSESMLARRVRLLSGLFSEIIVSVPFGGLAGMEELLSPSMLDSVTVVSDPLPGIGPLAGLISALSTTSSPAAFVSTVDAPYLVPSLTALLAAALTGHAAAVPLWRGYPEPLVACYSVDIIPAVQRTVDAGQHRIVSFYDDIDVVYVDERRIRAADPGGRSFVNINTPEEYRQLLAAVQREEK